MEKGNHCICDPGYQALHIKGKWRAQGEVVQGQRSICCPSSSIEKCKAQASNDGKQPGNMEGNAVTPSKDATKHAHDAFVKGYSEGTKHPKSRLKESASETVITDTKAKVIEVETETKAKVAEPKLESESDEIMQKAKAKGKKTSAYWSEMFAMPKHTVKGPDKVSKVCQGASATDCWSKGCKWNGVSCVDATRIECASKKKVLDCYTYKIPSPYALSFQITPNKAKGGSILSLTEQLQTLCGKGLLNQKEVAGSYCSAGYRRGFRCEINDDCPCVSDEGNKDSGTQLILRLSKKVCKRSASGRYVSECKEMSLVQSCSAEYMKPCTEYGALGDLSAMAI